MDVYVVLWLPVREEHRSPNPPQKVNDQRDYEHQGKGKRHCHVTTSGPALLLADKFGLDVPAVQLHDWPD